MIRYAYLKLQQDIEFHIHYAYEFAPSYCLILARSILLHFGDEKILESINYFFNVIFARPILRTVHEREQSHLWAIVIEMHSKYMDQ